MAGRGAAGSPLPAQPRVWAAFALLHRPDGLSPGDRIAAAQPCGEPGDGKTRLEPRQKEPSHPRLTQQIFLGQPWSPLGSTRIYFLQASPPPGTSGDNVPRPSDSLNVFNGTSRPKESRASPWDAIYGEVNGLVDMEPLDSPFWICLLVFAPGRCREWGLCTKITWRNYASAFC